MKTIKSCTRPPEHLSARSQALWAAVVPSRARSAERLALLGVALEALDRADQARDAVAADGMVKVTPRSGMARLHPLLKVERESRQLFARIWSLLNLQWNQQVDGRMPMDPEIAKALGVEPDDNDA